MPFYYAREAWTTVGCRRPRNHSTTLNATACTRVEPGMRVQWATEEYVVNKRVQVPQRESKARSPSWRRARYDAFSRKDAGWAASVMFPVAWVEVAARYATEIAVLIWHVSGRGAAYNINAPLPRL